MYDFSPDTPGLTLLLLVLLLGTLVLILRRVILAAAYVVAVGVLAILAYIACLYLLEYWLLVRDDVIGFVVGVIRFIIRLILVVVTFASIAAMVCGMGWGGWNAFGWWRTVLERLRLRRTTATARDSFRRFYSGENARLLRDRYPPEMFEADLRLELPIDLPPDEAWKAFRALIDRLNPIVVEERARTATTRRRVREIDAQIAECNQRLAALERPGLDADFVADERQAQLERLDRLEKQKELLQDLTNGDE